MLETREYETVEEMMENYARIKRQTFESPKPPPPRPVVLVFEPPPPSEVTRHDYRSAIGEVVHRRLRALMWARRRERLTLLRRLTEALAARYADASMTRTTIEIARRYGDMKLSDMQSDGRLEQVVSVRQLCMAVLHMVGPAGNGGTRSMPRIGRHLGGRDHTTVLHALRRFGVKS
jgi:hypothetical protein